MTHPKAEPGDALDESVAVCDRKVRGTGTWGWQATTPDGDETPTEAVSVALRASKTTKRRPGEGRASGDRTNGNRRAVVL